MKLQIFLCTLFQYSVFFGTYHLKYMPEMLINSIFLALVYGNLRERITHQILKQDLIIFVHNIKLFFKVCSYIKMGEVIYILSSKLRAHTPLNFVQKEVKRRYNQICVVTKKNEEFVINYCIKSFYTLLNSNLFITNTFTDVNVNELKK